jgi:hypothetical protein
VPSSKAASQKRLLLVARSARLPARMRPPSASRIVVFGPSRSSSGAMRRAPSPAVRLSAMPSWITSSSGMPKTPAA